MAMLAHHTIDQLHYGINKNQNDAQYMLRRREFLAAAGAIWPGPLLSRLRPYPSNGESMYGLIGKVIAVAGKRDELARILLEGTEAMPGCLNYVVALDPTDDDALWITEVWTDQDSHRASLSLPSVQAAIANGRPLIDHFESHVETTPLGGVGLDGRQ